MTDEAPDADSADRTAPLSARARAFFVHILTASGGAFALLALLAASERLWTLMFCWLGLALVIDGIDGPLARRLRVAQVLPRWSGDILDHVVDFLTYVVVPAFAIVASDLMPRPLAYAAGILIVVTSALYFADRSMKTVDNYFRGFPVVWNVVAFYLFLLTPPAWITATAIVAFTILTFAPIVFVHPLRVKRLRTLNVILLAVWAILVLVALTTDLNPGQWVVATLCLIAAYFVLAGLLRRPGSRLSMDP